MVAVAVVFGGGRVSAAGRGALGRRSGRARRGMCWGGGVSGVGARVVVVQGLAVAGSVGCSFWTDGMQCSGNFLSGAVGWFHVCFTLSSRLCGGGTAWYLVDLAGKVVGVYSVCWRGGLLIANFLCGR